MRGARSYEEEEEILLLRCARVPIQNGRPKRFLAVLGHGHGQLVEPVHSRVI